MVPTPEWAGISCKAVTFQSIADLNQDSDDDEVDELASSVEDIEEFCEMTKSSPVQREQGKRSPGEGVAQETHHSAKAGEEQKLDQHNLEHQMSEIIMSAGSDEVIFTPPEGRSDPLPQRVASNQANLPLPQPTSSDAGVKSAHRDANGDGLKCATPQDLNKNSDFFMEERVIVMKPDGTPALLDGKNTKSTANPDKPRVPLTQLHTDSLAALVAFKRRKKQQDGKITDFFGQKHTRERAATPTTDRKNVNGYLVLRSRGDLVRTPPPKVTTPPVQQPASLKAESATLSPASTQTFSKDKIADNIRATPSLPLKPFQALSKAPNPAANAIPPEPEYDLTNLAPLKCFGSFRLLQNSAIDRALDLHNVEVIYPEEDDPVSLRAIALSKTNRQSVVPQITQPDIILSPRACLFFYRLSYIYQMTTVLDSDFNEKRMHHSKILLDALRLFSQEYDKIVLVFEMFEPAQDLKNKSNKPVMNATTITPAIKRALEKLHNDIGALAEEIQRPLGEELDIDLLHAISPLQAAAFVRERLDLRFAKDVQLGQLGWVSMSIV